MTTVTLTMRDQQTLDVLSRLEQGVLRAAQAAELLGRSVRQVRRKLGAYRRHGIATVPHGNRGRTPHNALPISLRQRVAELAQDKYEQCNNHHLCELLAEHHHIQVSVSSVRRIRHRAGLRSPRTRRPPKHRSRRDRMPQAGMMLQIDASPAHWLGDQQPECTLLATIDDATNRVCAIFRTQEDTVGYLLLLRHVIREDGVPQSLYSDRHTIFLPPEGSTPSLDEQLAGTRPATQFGRAAHELGITQIPAGSPQAKGRVERLFGTLQDRLLQELRLAGITTLEQANAFLPGFLKRFNAKFAKAPADPAAAYRPAPKSSELDQILCLKFTRTVANDHTVSFGNRRLAVGTRSGPSYAHKRIEVHVALDGRLSFWYQGRRLGTGPTAYGELRVEPSRIVALLPPQEAPPPQRPAPQPPAQRTPRPSTAVKPAPDHPWRRFRYGKATRSVLQSKPPAGG